MNKTLMIIVAASVVVIIGMTLIPMMSSSLETTEDSSENLQKNTACNVQIREATRSDDYSIINNECIDYIEDPSIQDQAEEEAIDGAIFE